MAHDSSEVWSHPDWFYLDDQGQPSVVAGVLPDYFSATGQRWGGILLTGGTSEPDSGINGGSIDSGPTLLSWIGFDWTIFGGLRATGKFLYLTSCRQWSVGERSWRRFVFSSQNGNW
jgi:hypothetical protein